MTRPFDMIDLVVRAYRTLIEERAYLVRLGVIPALIVFMNFIIVSVVFPDLPPLRRGLAMFPAMVAEAWVVAQFLRTLLTRERWPMRLPPDFSGPLSAQAYARVRGLLSAILCYILVTLTMNGFAGAVMTLLLMSKKDDDDAQLAASLPPEVSLLALAALIAVLLNFRLVWIYTALVVNVPVRHYLNATRERILNFQLVGLWLATMLPLLFFSMTVLQPLLNLSNGNDIGSFVIYVLTAFLSVVTQMILALATSVAATLALAPLLFGEKGASS